MKDETAAIVAISRHGAALGARIRTELDSDSGDHTPLYVSRRFADLADGAVPFDLPARPLVERLFSERTQLILMMPVGAAVRLLAKRIGDKHTDAAVVCVDDAGRFAVSVLSGHAGGADALAQRVAAAIGATAVITSASHALGMPAVDMLGSEFDWRLEAGSAAVTRLSAAVVNDEPVGVYQDSGEQDWRHAYTPLPPNLTVCESLEDLRRFSNALLISDRTDISDTAAEFGPNTLVTYRPRSLVVGIGSRRGVAAAELEALLQETFADNRLAVGSIRCIATADLKHDEAGISMLADKLNAPLRYFSADELNSKPGPSPASASQRLLGIVGVAEPAALLASGGNIIVPKVRSASATLAVARIPSATLAVALTH